MAFRRSAVLVNQTAKDLPALDPGGDIDGLAELPLRRFLLERPQPRSGEDERA
jgi:hypothetical protein